MTNEELAELEREARHEMDIFDRPSIRTSLRLIEAIATAREAEALRKWVVKLYCASGCSCCRDDAGWEEATNALGKLLNIPEYEDGSGYDFYAVRAALERGEVK